MNTAGCLNTADSNARAVYIFVGPPGAGKGSLADLCVQFLGWQQFSTGNACRHHIARQTDLGKQIDFAIKSGKLVSDSLIVAMVANWLEVQADLAKAIILDGFPRTVAQASALDSLLKTSHEGLEERIITLAISDDAVIQRLCNRFICENKACQSVYSLAEGSNGALAPKRSGICDICSRHLIRRKDDEEETVRERLLVYHKHEQALLDYYTGNNKLVEQVAVNKPLKDVFQDFKQMIGLRA